MFEDIFKSILPIPSRQGDRNALVFGVLIFVSIQLFSLGVRPEYCSSLWCILTAGEILGFLLMLYAIAGEIVFREEVFERCGDLGDVLQSNIGKSIIGRYLLYDAYTEKDSEVSKSQQYQTFAGKLILIDNESRRYYWIKYEWTISRLNLGNLWIKGTYEEIKCAVKGFGKYEYRGILELSADKLCIG